MWKMPSKTIKRTAGRTEMVYAHKLIKRMNDTWVGWVDGTMNLKVARRGMGKRKTSSKVQRLHWGQYEDA